MDSGVLIWRGSSASLRRVPCRGTAPQALGERGHGGGELGAEVVEPVEAGEEALRMDADDAVELGGAVFAPEVAVDVLPLEVVPVEADGEIRIRGVDEAMEEHPDSADGHLAQHRGMGGPRDGVKRALGTIPNTTRS
jgi:hypothetical protein